MTSLELERPCPVCGSGDSREIFRQRFVTPGGGAPIRGYRVCCCVRCGFACAHGIPSQDVLDAHYRDASKYEHAHHGGAEPESDRRRFAETADRVASIWPLREGRVLEIGSATGGFLGALRARGYRHVVGHDPSPACARAAHRVHGVRVESLPIPELVRREGPFDLIVLLCVLEHVRDLRRFLGDLVRGLDRGGCLYAQVPDAARFPEDAEAPFQQFSTEHINYFTRASLANLMSTCSLVEEAAQGDVVTARPGLSASVVEGLYRSSPVPGTWTHDGEGEHALEEYVRRSREEEDRVASTLRDLARTGRRVVIWGAGTHTQRLLAAGRMDGIEIAAFVDSNPHLHGRDLAGRPILAPEALRSRTEPILVSSRGFQREIVERIQGELGPAREVITLYPAPEGAPPTPASSGGSAPVRDRPRKASA